MHASDLAVDSGVLHQRAEAVDIPAVSIGLHYEHPLRITQHWNIRVVRREHELTAPLFFSHDWHHSFCNEAVVKVVFGLIALFIGVVLFAYGMNFLIQWFSLKSAYVHLVSDTPSFFHRFLRTTIAVPRYQGVDAVENTGSIPSSYIS